jgi:rhomboid protease GluP
MRNITVSIPADQKTMTYPIPPSRPPGARPGNQFFNRTIIERAWVSYMLLIVTLAVFLLQMLSQLILKFDFPVVLGAKINEAIYAGEVWRFLTPVLLHGSIFHIGFNMYALLIIGPDVEQSYGHLRFFLLYILAGIAGNVASFYFSAATSVGASTALFGMIAAQGIFVYQNRELFGSRARSVLSNIIFIVGVNLLLGLSPGIDNWGHMGGLVGGLAFAWFAGPRFRQEIVRVPDSMTLPSIPLDSEVPGPDSNPSFAIRLIDQVTSNQIWITTAVELLVLTLLIATRIFNNRP